MYSGPVRSRKGQCGALKWESASSHTLDATLSTWWETFPGVPLKVFELARDVGMNLGNCTTFTMVPFEDWEDEKICIDHLFSSLLIPCFPYNKEIVICAMKGRKWRPRKTRHWSTLPRCYPGRQSSWSVPVSSPGIGAASLEKVHLRYLFRKFWHLIIIHTCVLLLQMMIRDISSKTKWN